MDAVHSFSEWFMYDSHNNDLSIILHYKGYNSYEYKKLELEYIIIYYN